MCVYPHIHRGEISKPRYQTLITVFTFKGGDCLCKEGNRTSLYHFLNWQHYEWRLIWFAFQCFLHFKTCVYTCTCVYGLHACACVCAHLCVCLIISNDMCTFITSLTVELERTGQPSWFPGSCTVEQGKFSVGGFISTTQCTSLWPRASNSLSACFLIFCFLFAFNVNWTFTVLERGQEPPLWRLFKSSFTL